MPATGPKAVARRLASLAARPRTVFALALLVTAATGTLAARLHLRTSLVELLPTRDPAVENLERTRSRMPDLNPLLIGIRSPDRAANLRYAGALTRHLRGLPPGVCALALDDLGELDDFVRANRWLYLPESELVEVRDRLRAVIAKHKNPLLIDLGEDDGQSAEQALESKLKKLGARGGAFETRFPEGHFVRGDYAWVVALPPGGVLSESAGAALIEAVRGFVAVNPPTGFHPQMQVVPAGPVMSTVRNREAVERDVVSVTVACVLVIGLSIGLFFRSLRVLPLVVAPAVLGTLLALAAATLAFGYLNSSTAFLGSIILGNGINAAIILVAEYREQRSRRGWAPAEALALAIERVWRSTLAAAICAAVAYASLMLTSFRGFFQFGLMGAVGSLGSWAATFLVLPALLGRFAAAGWAGRAAPIGLTGLDGVVRRHHGVVLLASLLLTLGAGLGLRHFATAPFEYDFRKLGAPPEASETYHEFEGNLGATFGRWHTPTVLLAERPEQVEPMRQALRRRDDARHPVIGRVVSLADLLPGAPDEQGRKLAVLASIRRLASDPGLDLLDADRRLLLRENIPPAHLRALDARDLPELARRPFTERDGTLGRVLLVYPSERVSMWDGHDLLATAEILQTLTLPDGATIRSSGSPMIFGAMVRSVLHDGPRATALALGAVLLVVSLIVRPARLAGLAALAMLVGVTWMLGGAGAAGVRITFLNFIALPITFGIGIEYAVNMAARLRHGRPAGSVAEPSAAGGSASSAVVLCSWTTIVGYGSLLAARSQALRGFGALAILGELACLLAAVFTLPALLAWRPAWRAWRRAGAAQSSLMVRSTTVPGAAGAPTEGFWSSTSPPERSLSKA